MIFSTLLGEEVELKYCIKCKCQVPLSMFTARARDKNGNISEWRTDCDPCKRIYDRELQGLKKYNKIPSDYNQCPLCLRTKEDLATQKYKTKFVLDHNHKTKKIRGWICHDCNNGLARAHENPDTLRRMAEYIEKHQ